MTTTTEMPSGETQRPAPEGEQRRGHRPWIAIPLAVATIGGLVYLNFFTELTRDFRWIGSVIVGGSGLILLAFWMLFLSRFSRAARLSTVLIPLLLVGVFFSLFEMTLDGDLVPIGISYRWGGKPHQGLAAKAENVSEATLTSSADSGFPQFLGPDRDGVVHGVDLARGWPEPPPRVWGVEIGAGWSGFAVVGDNIFTQEMRNGREMVTCLKLDSGDLAWRQFHETDESAEGFISAISGDGPRATPSVVDGKVYAASSLGTISCFNAYNGDRLWTTNVLSKHNAALTIWGYSSSPLVRNDLVIVTGGGKTGPALVALDRQTGEVVWTAGEGGECSDAYSSPTLAKLCGQEQLLLVTDVSIDGYDPANGKRLWRQGWPWKDAQHAKISQPMPLPGDRVLVTAAYSSGSAAFEVSRGDDGAYSTKLLWKNRNLKTKFSNPIVRGDYAFGLDSIVLSCIDTRTGKTMWKGGRFGHGQLLQVNDLTLIVSEYGEVALMELTPEKVTELGRFTALDDKTWNTLAISGNKLLVRNDRQAACFALPTK